MNSLDKPKRGEPCNGCGWCCQQELCPVGKQVFGDIPGPCPALVPAANRYWCGFVLTEDMTRTPTQITIGMALGIGKGCSADDP